MEAKFGNCFVTIERDMESTSGLVAGMYGARGYTPSHSIDEYSVLVNARIDGSLVGTALLRIDSANSLYADEIYRSELDEMRSNGSKLIEISRFVIAPGQDTIFVIWSMFHCFYYHAVMRNGCTDMICEVIPRHAAPHRRILGFTKIAGPRPCGRVGVEAAVLLHREIS